MDINGLFGVWSWMPQNNPCVFFSIRQWIGNVHRPAMEMIPHHSSDVTTVTTKKKTHLDWFEVGLKIYWKQRWFFPVQKEDVPAFPSSLGNAVCRGQTCPNGFLKVGKWWYAKKDTKTIEITCSISFRLTKNHGMKSGRQFGEPLQVASKRRLSQPREIAPKTHRSSNCQLQATNSAIAHHGSHQQCSVFQTCAAQPTGKTYALRRKAHATAKGLSGWKLGKIEPGSRRLKTNGTWRIL